MVDLHQQKYQAYCPCWSGNSRKTPKLPYPFHLLSKYFSKMTSNPDEQRMVAKPAGFMRRLAAMMYDWVLLLAVILVAVSLFTVVADLLLGREEGGQVLEIPWVKWLYQLYLVVVAAGFYLWFWTHGGQTLGMKVWKLRLVDNDGQPIGTAAGIKRLFFALLSCLPAGIGLWWMLFNSEKLALYDRWSATRLVQIEQIEQIEQKEQ